MSVATHLTRLTVLWPPFAGSSGTGPPPTTYFDLLEALIAHLDSDLSVTASLSGGVWSDEAPVGVPFPYAVITEIAGESEYSTADEDGDIPYADDQTFQIAVYGPGKTQSRTSGMVIDRSINDADLIFDSGTLLYLRRDGAPFTQIDDSLGPGGVDVWQRITVYRAMIQRTL